MTVEDLIEELRAMPPTAMVFVKTPLVDREEVYEFIDTPIEAVVYDMAQVSIRLEE